MSGYPECTFTSNFKRDEQGKINLLKLEKPEVLEEKCPQCGKPLRKVVGKFGPFIACSGYPECKYIQRKRHLCVPSYVAAKCMNAHGEVANFGDVKIIQNVNLRYLVKLKKYHVPNVNHLSWSKKLIKMAPLPCIVRTKNVVIRQKNKRNSILGKTKNFLYNFKRILFSARPELVEGS